MTTPARFESLLAELVIESALLEPSAADDARAEVLHALFQSAARRRDDYRRSLMPFKVGDRVQAASGKAYLISGVVPFSDKSACYYGFPMKKNGEPSKSPHYLSNPESLLHVIEEETSK